MYRHHDYPDQHTNTRYLDEQHARECNCRRYIGYRYRSCYWYKHYKLPRSRLYHHHDSKCIQYTSTATTATTYMRRLYVHDVPPYIRRYMELCVSNHCNNNPGY